MDQIILGKTVLAVLLGICEIVFYKYKDFIEKIGSQRPIIFYVLVLFVFRFIPFLSIYYVLNFETTSDVPIFYESAKAAISGGVVYKDFQTSYSPLFPYLIGLILPFWNSSKAIVFILILLESVFVWSSRKLTSFKNPFYITLFYYALPCSLVFSVIGGQEDVLMWGFLSIVLLIYLKNKKHFILGISLGFALLLTKFIFVLIVPAAFFYFKNRSEQLKVMLGLITVGLPTFVLLYCSSKWGFLYPLTEANVPRTPNIWSLFNTLTGGLTPYGPKYVNWIGLGLIELLLIYVVMKFMSTVAFEKFISASFVITYAWLMIVQQSSYANYAYAFLLPLVFILPFNSKEFYVFVGFNILLVIQPAIWWRTGLIRVEHLGQLKEPLKLFLFLAELVLIFGLLWIIKKVIRSM